MVEKLVADADIVLEGFRPGVAKRLGIDYETLKKHNPKLIYCSISGYGQTGPWRERPGHDVNYVAAAGALAFPGHWLKPPARSSLPVADMGGGAFAAVAVLSSLLHKPTEKAPTWTFRCSRARSSGPRCATASTRRSIRARTSSR